MSKNKEKQEQLSLESDEAQGHSDCANLTPNSWIDLPNSSLETRTPAGSIRLWSQELFWSKEPHGS